MNADVFKDGLDAMRWRGMLILAAISGIATVTVIVCSIWTGSMVAPIQAVLVGIVPAALVLQKRRDALARTVMAIALPLYPAILLGQWHSGPWVIDLHMLFFAVLATVVILADWRPVIAAAGVIAVHHLLLNFVAPQFVFGTDGDFARVLLHAVIVIIETAVLVALARQVENLIIHQEEARQQQEQLEETARAHRAQVEAEQREVIGSLRERLLSLAAGKVGDRINGKFPPAYEELRHATNEACEQLQSLIGDVADVSSFVITSVGEIRAASDDLARRTEMQAGSLEQNSALTRRLLEQITGTAKQAGQVNEAVRLAGEDSQGSRIVLDEAVLAMGAIERSSAEISQFISLIDGISFQTNLLALNAGVEAARAGDSGKGFAVVANEVRALAQRSADAANMIKNLVAGSSGEVTRGADLVAKSGKSLESLDARVIEIREAVAEIARSAATQAEDLRKVTEVFGQIDNATQQNAAMVEENNAAARGLAEEAERLAQSVGRFDAGPASGQPTLRRAA